MTFHATRFLRDIDENKPSTAAGRKHAPPGKHSSMTKPGRNDPCSCGSGRKFKRCCLSRAASSAPQANDTETGALTPSQAIQVGVAHHQAGRLSEAEAIYRQVLQADPGNPDALHLLGLIAHQVGQFALAAELIGHAVRVKPSGPLYYNLGVSLQASGRLDEAVESYRQALLTMPDDARVHGNLGVIFQQKGQLPAAVDYCRNAIALRPDDAGAHRNLGAALAALGRLDEAVTCFRQAIALAPHDAEAHKDLGHTLGLQGDIDGAVRSFHEALGLRPDFARAHDQLLFLYANQALLAPSEYLSVARHWEQSCLTDAEREAAGNRAFVRTPVAGRRLRVGYVSGDFRQHAISYFVEQLFTHHDRSRIELFAYANNGQGDAVTGRLRNLVDHWVPIAGLSDPAARDRITNDGIDVLIDLSGHTAHNRLGVFAHRAAPVQVHYLGFFASTGLSEMDYWIGDDTLTPRETDSHFSEQVWRLPRVWVCYDGKSDAPRPACRPASESGMCLGSFNSLNKVTPATLALWADVLNALPEARLLLKTKELADAGNRQRILGVMASHGIAANRIELEDSSATPGWREHMDYYNRVDIALDPVGGVSGGTTTCDALWMGVPVVGRDGDRVASRMTASMLAAIDHPEWIARSDAEYVDRVVALTRDRDYRRNLRETLRTQMARSALCDAVGMAATLESAYVEMFERWHTSGRRMHHA